MSDVMIIQLVIVVSLVLMSFFAISVGAYLSHKHNDPGFVMTGFVFAGILVIVMWCAGLGGMKDPVKPPEGRNGASQR